MKCRYPADTSLTQVSWEQGLPKGSLVLSSSGWNLKYYESNHSCFKLRFMFSLPLWTPNVQLGRNGKNDPTYSDTKNLFPGKVVECLKNKNK